MWVITPRDVEEEACVAGWCCLHGEGKRAIGGQGGRIGVRLMEAGRHVPGYTSKRNIGQVQTTPIGKGMQWEKRRDGGKKSLQSQPNWARRSPMATNERPSEPMRRSARVEVRFGMSVEDVVSCARASGVLSVSGLVSASQGQRLVGPTKSMTRWCDWFPESIDIRVGRSQCQLGVYGGSDWRQGAKLIGVDRLAVSNLLCESNLVSDRDRRWRGADQVGGTETRGSRGWWLSKSRADADGRVW